MDSFGDPHPICFDANQFVCLLSFAGGAAEEEFVVDAEFCKGAAADASMIHMPLPAAALHCNQAAVFAA